MSSLTVLPDGTRHPDRPVRAAVLSGSFDPLHFGHLELLRVTATVSGLPPVFELPVVNADKGLLAADEVERRLAQFAGRHTVVLTRLPLFGDKAALFPGSVFAVGVDTARRIVDPRYHGGPEALVAALAAVEAAGCRFLVAGRLDGGRFTTLSDLGLPDLGLPAEVAHLFEMLPEERFRADVSSSELRAARRVPSLPPSSG